MKDKDHIIIGIHVTDRVTKASAVQDVLTGYGCSIRTRLGLHQATEDFCSTSGVILIELIPGCDKAGEMLEKLNSIEGIETQKIQFSH